MSRYWNGHQWKDLPVATVQANSPVAVDEPAGVDPRTTSEPAAPVVAAVDEAAVPTRSGLVPTHADYGDVFVAAVAEAVQ